MGNSPSLATKKKGNRAWLPNYILFPRIQIKYALMHSAIVLIALLFCMLGEFYLLKRFDFQAMDPFMLASSKESLMQFNIILLLISTGLTFVVSILVTHRFLGPMIAIRRSLEQYKENQKIEKIVIRKTDEIHFIVDDLNQFFQGLNEK